MYQMEMPQVNVLSKVDLAEQQGRLAFGLDFYTEVLDLNYLVETMNADPFLGKYRKLSGLLADVVENSSLVNFMPLCVSDVETLRNVRAAVDQANGYIFGAGENYQQNMASLLSVAIGAKFQGDLCGNVSEKYFEEESDGDEQSNSMSVE